MSKTYALLKVKGFFQSGSTKRSFRVAFLFWIMSTCMIEVFAQSTVTVLLTDSHSNQLSSGSLQYYEGGWNTVSANADGSFTVQTTASSLTYRMTYQHGSQTLSNIPVSTDTVVFQTVNVEVQLKDSQDNLIDEGSVEYYAGGWHNFGITNSGVAEKELLPSSYTFRMTYEYGGINKEQDVGTNNVVEFQTVKTDVQLINSLGNLIDEGTVEYYSGGWHNFGTTSGGVASKELLPKSYTFRMVYEHGGTNKEQNIASDPVVQFQTVKTEVALRNSLGNLIDEGTVQYYSGGWHDFGTTSGGVTFKELLPKNYTFRMTYEHGSNNKAQNISSNSLVEFQTVKADVELRNSSGQLTNEGEVEYYSGGWHNFGITSGGIASKELLPRNYTFRMEYEYGGINKAQNIGDDQVVTFNTASVTVRLQNGSSINNGEVTYYAGGWHSFGAISAGEATKELLPRNYTFRVEYNDEAEQKAQDVSNNTLVLFQATGVAEPPVLTVNEPAEGLLTAEDTVAVSGSVDNPGFTTVMLNGQNVTVETDGSFSTSVILDEGNNEISVLAENQDELTNEITRTVILDTTPPFIAIDTEDGSYSADAETNISGTVSEPVSALIVNTDTVAVNPDKSFSTSVTISEGPNDIIVEAVDLVGNTTTETLGIFGDFTSPELLTGVVVGADGPDSEFIDITEDDTLQLDLEEILLVGAVRNELTDVVVTINGDTVETEESYGGGSNYFDNFEKNVGLGEGANPFTIIATDQAGNSSQRTITIVTPTTYDPHLAINNPVNNFVTDTSSILVSGTVVDSSLSVSLTLNGLPIEVTQTGTYSYEFEQKVFLFPGDNYLSVRVVNSNENEAIESRKVIRDFITAIPPDPETVAPQIDSTVVTTIYNSTDFLYKGENPVQYGVENNVIDSTMNGVVKGRVLDANGNPLSGVLVTVKNYPEFGYTNTRGDGEFDLVVNGGGYQILDFKKDGYLSVQRKAKVPLQNYEIVDDIRMTALDPNVTTVDFSDSIEVARGSLITDEDGNRQGTLMFEQGTSAEMVLPDGSVLPLSSLDVRATEYTVGANGPDAMPAILPPNSGYTYCVELSVDEALQAGANEVRFDKPVAYYVENFIGFPVGSDVPTGYYDREEGKWIASKDGRVIEIVSIASGLAEVDITGNGVADAADSLSAIGLDIKELEQLASLYQPGESLWRTEITHFTPWDHNWPYQPPADAVPPTIEQPEPYYEDNDNSSCESGSVISVQNQTLGEAVGITGAPCGLHYNSANVRGFKRNFTVPINLTGDSVPSSLDSIVVAVNVAGRTVVEVFPGVTDQSYEFEWDGKDAYGRYVNGAQILDVRIGYVYDAEYLAPGGSFDNSFGNSGEEPLITTNRVANTITLWQDWSTTIGGLIRPDFGSWQLGIHHQYDLGSRMLYKGNGLIRKTEANRDIVRGYLDESDLDGRPIDMAFDDQGNLFIAVSDEEDELYRIIKRQPDGAQSTVIEFEQAPSVIIGSIGFSDAYSFNYSMADEEDKSITQIDVGPEGRVYFTDQRYNRLYRVNHDRTLEVIAGTGEYGYSGDNGPADSAKIDGPTGIAIDSDGTIYFTDKWNRVVRKIGTDGIITTYAGGGNTFYSYEGPALNARFDFLSGLAIDEDGTLYIVDSDRHRIRMVTQDGMISNFAGTGEPDEPVPDNRGDGGLATDAILINPTDVAVGEDGSVYIAEQYAHQIRKVTPEGIIYRLAGLYGENPYNYSPYLASDEGGLILTMVLHREPG